jgi:hypothetical protein
MVTEKFTKEDLLNALENDCDTLEKVSDDLTGTSRWSTHHRLVFKAKESGKFYEANYSRGATESQDESPFEYEPDLVECAEVRPVERVITVYERVP